MTTDAERLAAIRELRADSGRFSADEVAALDHLLTVAAEYDAEKERADQAESALLEVEDRLRAPGYGNSDSKRIALLHIESWRSGTARVRHSPEAERDALRACIEAALGHAFEHQNTYGGWPHVVALMHAALAGNQPGATPEVAEMCDHYRGADEGCPAGCFATPKPPHLDPEPMLWPQIGALPRGGHRHALNYVCDIDPACEFDPRPGFEQDRAAYEVTK